MFIQYTYTMKTVEERVNELIEKVRPYIKMHGGDVSLVRIDGETAVLKIYGACVGCSLANETYNKTIVPLIIKDVKEIKKVEFE